ncbi:oxygenase MpaB family protein [Nocardioides caeni]|nr:oxygenase MpaB family protein [Nocardioides caeni]
MTTSVERTPTRVRDVPVPAGFDMRDHLSGIGAHLAGPANVILQLSWPAVGYGVMNSRVHDGAAMKRPFKRGRTTFTYIAVAMLGTDEERAAFRKEVNRQHAQVVSREGEPVQYRGMDPGLQTWVAACLYYGTVDMIEKMHGPITDEAEADALYAHCARFGTTLQMPADAWPADRAAFDAYWEDGLAQASIDPAIAQFLLTLTEFKNFPKPFHTLGRGMVFITTGFLPPEIREAMSLPWNRRMQKRFDRILRIAGRIERALPRFLKNFPFNLYLWDMRMRRRFRRPLV